MMKRLIRMALVAMLVFLNASIYAQVTTSGISGKVSSGNEAIIGATIMATHTSSGTVYGAVSNADGRFNIVGMRVGGPYEIKISYIGFENVVIPNVVLQLGETYPVNVDLNEDNTELQEVVVSALRTKFTSEKTGAATNITSSQIQSLPSVSRSILDVTRLSPYGGNGMSFGGTDGRTSNFTVDGANFNNNFGLSSSLPGGGSPISIEAIEELQVVITPYDVRQTNFIGGGVNAITKSGTNTLKGSAYVFHRNENMRGDAEIGRAHV